MAAQRRLRIDHSMLCQPMTGHAGGGGAIDCHSACARFFFPARTQSHARCAKLEAEVERLGAELAAARGANSGVFARCAQLEEAVSVHARPTKATLPSL